MEILRILFALGFLAPGYYAMEIQPPILPRNLDVYCKFCDGLSAVFDNFSYEDYDIWRTIDIQEKFKFFCSFCKNKTESTTKPAITTETTIPSITTTTSRGPGTTSTSTPLATETSPAPASTPLATETSPAPASTPSTSQTPSSSTENTSPPP